MLGARPRYSPVADEDIKKPTNQTSMFGIRSLMEGTSVMTLAKLHEKGDKYIGIALSQKQRVLSSYLD